jgi:hypothetical protein
MEKVGFVASYWLEKQLIEIGRFLRQQNSPCHYNDYVNVFRPSMDLKFLLKVFAEF